MMREETTTFKGGCCEYCGSATYTPYDGGVYCDGCRQRITSGMAAGGGVTIAATPSHPGKVATETPDGITVREVSFE